MIRGAVGAPDPDGRLGALLACAPMRPERVQAP
jgi:hypothetical protein